VYGRCCCSGCNEIQKRAAACQKLGDFADSYNRGAIDIKKVESVRKAWREVEKNEAWFKESK
jgi:hypothetical protein